MKCGDDALLIMSPLLLAFAYLFPDYMAWLIFLFLIPLFFLVLRSSIKSPVYWFFYGLLWGIVFFLIHWVTLFHFFMHYASGALRILLYPALVLYASLWSGIWFFICSVASTNIFIKWTSGTFFYFYFFEHYAIAPLGCNAGYPFINPLVVLASDHRWCAMLSLFTRHGLLILLILFQMGCAYIIVNKQIWLSFVISLLLIPFAYGWIKEGQAQWCINYNTVVPISIPAQPYASYLDCAQEIANRLIDAISKHPKATLFIMPETSFPFDLHNQTDVIDMWTDNVLSDDKVLLLGSQYIDIDKSIFNASYTINKGRITHNYFKKKLVPYIEYLPPVATSFTFLPSLLFYKKRAFSIKKEPANDGNLVKIHSTIYSIYICSEFFLHMNTDLQTHNPIVLLVNDSWFMSYFQYIMYLYAQLHVFEFQVYLIYSGFFYSTILYPYDYCK